MWYTAWLAYVCHKWCLHISSHQTTGRKSTNTIWSYFSFNKSNATKLLTYVGQDFPHKKTTNKQIIRNVNKKEGVITNNLAAANCMMDTLHIHGKRKCRSCYPFQIQEYQIRKCFHGWFHQKEAFDATIPFHLVRSSHCTDIPRCLCLFMRLLGIKKSQC